MKWQVTYPSERLAREGVRVLQTYHAEFRPFRREERVVRFSGPMEAGEQVRATVEFVGARVAAEPPPVLHVPRIVDFRVPVGACSRPPAARGRWVKTTEAHRGHLGSSEPDAVKVLYWPMAFQDRAASYARKRRAEGYDVLVWDETC